MSPSKNIGLLLIHGLTGTPGELQGLAKWFTKQGIQTRVPLLAGHGEGHTELLASTWQDWQTSLKDSLVELSQTCDYVYICGLCMGGMLGLSLAINNPALVSGVIVLSPFVGKPNTNLTWLERLGYWCLPCLFRIPWLFDKFYWTEKPPYGLKDQRLIKRITRSLERQGEANSPNYGQFRTYLGSFFQFHQLIAWIRNNSKCITQPVLILHAEEDTLSSQDNALVLYRMLTTPIKKLVFLSGTDHMLSVDLAKNDVAALIHQFITTSDVASIEQGPHSVHRIIAG